MTHLTAREEQIVRAICRGEHAKHIASGMGISVKTVRNHLSHIYSKLEVYDRVGLVLWVARHGLIDDIGSRGVSEEQSA